MNYQITAQHPILCNPDNAFVFRLHKLVDGSFSLQLQPIFAGQPLMPKDLGRHVTIPEARKTVEAIMQDRYKKHYDETVEYEGDWI